MAKQFFLKQDIHLIIIVNPLLFVYFNSKNVCVHSVNCFASPLAPVGGALFWLQASKRVLVARCVHFSYHRADSHPLSGSCGGVTTLALAQRNCDGLMDE